MRSSVTIKDRMIRSVSMRRSEIVLRSDFERMGSQSQISRVLVDFVREGRLVRIGYGVFAKARRSSLSGKPVPRQPLEVLVAEALRRLNIEASVGQPEQEYASGKSTQVPILTTFNTGRRRISRKLMLGKRSIRYENDYRTRA